MENVEFRDGAFWTVPPAPEVVSTETIQGWLVEAEAQKGVAERNLAQAEESKIRTAADQDATITKHQEDVLAAEANIAAIQALLDQMPS